jgi:hypothetical protein
MSLHILIVLLCATTISVDAFRRLKSQVPALRAVDSRFNDPDCIAPDCRSESNYVGGSSWLEDYINERFFYFADVNMAGQRLRLLLDTGSGSMWINDGSNEHAYSCPEPSVLWADSDEKPLFIYNDSGQLQHSTENYSTDYLDGTRVDGTRVSSSFLVYDQIRDQPEDNIYGNDETRTVGSVEQTFGLATNSQQCIGIMGIGYLAEDEPEDMSLVKNLRKQERIQSDTYSLYPSPNTEGGSILFGAVDVKKFNGNLIRVPLNPGVRTSSQRTVKVSQIATRNEDKPQDETLNLGRDVSAVLDVGSVLTYLPEEDVEKLIKGFEADRPQSIRPFEVDASDSPQSQREELYMVDCSWRNSMRYVNFTLESVTIQIPAWKLILPVSVSTDPNHCVFGIASTNHSQEIVVLGFTFFTSAYVVFDLGKDEVFLAPSNENTTETDIRNITMEGVLSSIGEAPKLDSGNSDEGESTPIEDSAIITYTWSVLTLCGVTGITALLVQM